MKFSHKYFKIEFVSLKIKWYFVNDINLRKFIYNLNFSSLKMGIIVRRIVILQIPPPKRDTWRRPGVHRPKRCTDINKDEDNSPKNRYTTNLPPKKEIPEEGRRAHRPKRCTDINKDEDNSPKNRNTTNPPPKKEIPEEGRRAHRPKRCTDINKDEDNSPKNRNTTNYNQTSSHRFRKIHLIVL